MVDNTVENMVTVSRAEIVARKLFPLDYHDGHDCRGEYDRDGQPCGICAAQRRDWLARVAEVRAAMIEAFR